MCVCVIKDPHFDGFRPLQLADVNHWWLVPIRVYLGMFTTMAAAARLQLPRWLQFRSHGQLPSGSEAFWMVKDMRVCFDLVIYFGHITFLSIYLPTYLPTYLSIYPSIYLSNLSYPILSYPILSYLILSISLPACLSVYLSIFLSISVKRCGL